MFTLQQQYASETVVFFIVNDVDIINKIPNPKLNINNFLYRNQQNSCWNVDSFLKKLLELIEKRTSNWHFCTELL